MLAPAVQAEGPVLTRSCVPNIGQTISHQNLRPSGIVIRDGGANAVWDYSTLTDSGDVYSEQYLEAAGTPYHSLFPQANIAVKTQLTSLSYTYFLLNNDRMEAFGIASSSDTDRMTNPRLISTFPRAYQSMLKDDYAGRVSGDPDIVYSASDSSYVDGYGTLKLPHGLTYTDVVRVVSHIQYTMAEVTDTSQKMTFSMTRYSHFSSAYPAGSLFSLGYIHTFIGSRINQADYVRSIPDEVKDANSTLYMSLQPQPASDLLTIKGSDPADRIGSIDVYNQHGELCMHVDAQQQYSSQVQLTQLPSGVYLLRIQMNGKLYDRTHCVVH